MKRIAPLLIASLIIACGGGSEESEDEVTETPDAAAESTETEEDTVASDWPKIGDGIPEFDESTSTTTESGLQIITVSEGEGASPAAGDMVAVHYHGWLASDGTQFDSSANRGDPITFPLGAGRVIPGWDEGIAAMKVGGKARLRIPFDQAYGENGRGPIPAKADLVFDVWLVGAFPGPTDAPPEIDESGAVTSPTGLTKILISEGSGEAIGSSRVLAHYHGWLAPDGAMFDSSSRHPRPPQFPIGVGMVIPGWDEGISEMKKGEVARFRIPSALAYGENSPGPDIPANSDLVFDVWLVSAQAMPSRSGMPTGHP